MVKVLLADKLDKSGIKIFNDRGIETVSMIGLSPDDLAIEIKGYDGLLIRSGAQVTAKVLEAADKLKVVCRGGVGVDNIDLEAAKKAGVVVMNTPLANILSTAEHTLLLILAICRNLGYGHKGTLEGKWPKSACMGIEATGKTLGVVGCGKIGSIVARRAKALGMNVVVYDPFLSEEKAKEMGAEIMLYDELLANSDIITLHTPLLPETKGMINKQAIAKMKKGVRIVNCARGALIVDEDLAEGLRSGHVAGAAIDVYAEEPAKEHVLFGFDNVICTPHIAASTYEAQENVSLQAAEQMCDMLLLDKISNQVA